MTSWRLGWIVGALVTAVKLPLLFTTLGEDDQGRLIIDALIWLKDGPATLHPYGIFTSPLWTLPVAGIAALFGPSGLVMLTNVGGWLCGGLITMLALVLLRRLGASRSWATTGALATALIPGTFYISLYGYPSQYGLPLLLGSAVAFLESFEARSERARKSWLAVSGFAFCALVLMKVDFALAGTFLLSIAIVTRRLSASSTKLLPVFALAGAASAYLVGVVAVDGQDLIGFLGTFNNYHPWEHGAVLSSSSTNVLYACGFGTVALWVGGLIGGVVMGRETGYINRIAIASVVGAVPLWVFWLARPPISTRHVVPGALVIVLFAALMASRLLKNVRFGAPIWLIGLVAINAFFGDPGFDFNYRPTGNLMHGLYVNRKAFAVCDRIARDVASSPEPVKVIVGPRRWDEFGGIDFVPTIEVELAARNQSVSFVRPSAQGGYEHLYRSREGQETRLLPYLPPLTPLAPYNVAGQDVAFFSMWSHDLRGLRESGTHRVVVFEPDKMYARIEPGGIYRLLNFFNRVKGAR